jgi:hypothetical protein
VIIVLNLPEELSAALDFAVSTINLRLSIVLNAGSFPVQDLKAWKRDMLASII